MFNQKLFDLDSLNKFVLVKGIELESASKVLVSKAEFNLMAISFIKFLKTPVILAFDKLSQNDINNLRDVFGINRQKSFDQVIDECLSEVVTEILSVIRILTSYDISYDLERQIKIRELKLPTFILEIVKMINSLRMTELIEGTDSFIDFESIKVNFIDKKLGSRSHHKDSGIHISLKRINTFFLIIGGFSIQTITDFKDLYAESQFSMNISCEQKIKDRVLTSVVLHVGREHTKEDVEMALLTLCKYTIKSSENLRYTSITLSANQIFDCLSYDDVSYEGKNNLLASSKIKINRIIQSIYSSGNKEVENKYYKRIGSQDKISKSKVDLNTISSDSNDAEKGTPSSE